MDENVGFDDGVSPLKLKRIKIYDLLGWFDHDVTLPDDWEFTIIHGPNGVGKTKLLELTAAAVSLNPGRVFAIPFRRAEFHFSDDSVLELLRENLQTSLPIEEEIYDQPSSVSFRLKKAGRQNVNWTVRQEVPSRLSPTMRQRIERTLPVERLGPDLWLDRRTGDAISVAELVERFPDELPFDSFEASSIPADLQVMASRINIHLIETQRLVRSTSDRKRSGQGQRSTVLEFADDLAKRIGNSLAENSRRSQTLDRTFPSRVLGIQGPPSVSDEEIRARYYQQSELRESLAELAVLDASPELSLPDRALEPWERLVLWTYLNDAEEKLATFDDLLRRVQLLREILSERFLFKRIVIDREHGFRFLTHKGKEISPRSLSSGEQQELVLIYDLLFNVKAGSMVLIDEPEISLHVTWQRRFLDDIRSIAELSDLRFLVATHSPQIINKWWDRTHSLFAGEDPETGDDWLEGELS